MMNEACQGHSKNAKMSRLPLPTPRSAGTTGESKTNRIRAMLRKIALLE